MSSRAAAYALALQTLQHCRLVAARAQLSNTVRRSLHALQAEAIKVLRQQSARRRPRTLRILRRLERLERELADLPAGVRAAAIRERLRLSRTRYYVLRSVAASPENKAGLEFDSIRSRKRKGDTIR